MQKRGAGTTARKGCINKVMIFISLIAGILGAVFSGILYRMIQGTLWSPLAVGISFMIFAAVFIFIMVIANMLNGNLERHMQKRHDGGKIALLLIIIILLTLVFGTIFEFIYELNLFSVKRGYQEPTSYVFIIDNSGSMEQSDPDGLRYEAIKQIIAQKDDSFPYAVYSFSDGLQVDRELAPISAGNNDFETQVLGGTAIRKTLNSLYDLYEDGQLDGMGNAPKFLLLSDGYSTDIGRFFTIDRVLKKYAKTDIAISTVGLGQTDESLMQQIADATGGVFISVDNVGQLEDSMQQAVVQTGQNKYDRTLYTYRNVPKLDFLYAIMRIVFTAILGILISASMLIATGRDEDGELIMTTSVISGVLAGLLLEFAINLFGVSPAFIRYLYFLLVAVTFITVAIVRYSGRGTGPRYKDEMEEIGGGRVKREETKRISNKKDDFDW